MWWREVFPGRKCYYHIAHAGIRTNRGKEIDWSHFSLTLELRVELPMTSEEGESEAGN